MGELKGSTHKLYEDRYRLLPTDIPLVREADRGEIYAVFDGVGSAPKGMQAAQAMADGLLEFFELADIHEPSRGGLQSLLEEASDVIFGWGLMEGTDRPLGASAGAILWLHEKRATIFNAGDTEAWLFRQGECRGVIHDPGAGSAIQQYFGKGIGLQITVEELQVRKGDQILLFTDGLAKAVPFSRVREAMNQGDKPEIVVRHLMDAAERNRAQDDVTAMLVSVGEGSPVRMADETKRL